MELARFSSRLRLLLVLAAPLVSIPCGAQQQTAATHIGYVYPAGGRQGTTVEVVVGGQYLASPSAALLSGAGVHADVGEYSRPMNNQEAQAIREKLEAARKKLLGEEPGLRMPGIARIAKEAGVTEAELAALEEFRLSRTDPKRQQNPQIQEKVKLSVHIDADAAPGDRELRLVTARGMSNPIRFQVGQYTERNEVEPNDTKPAPGAALVFPVVLNGQIMPGDVDRFAFRSRKGVHLVFAVSARRLMPYLADAVPGWFQPVIAVYDASGKRLAVADSYRFSPDPVLFCTIPADGIYTLEVHDAVYRGREDFVYRIAAGELPFITSIFPMGGPTTRTTTVAVTGWNLPMSRVAVDGRAEKPGTIPVTVRSGLVVSDSVPFEISDLPEKLAVFPKGGGPLAVKLPVVLDGRIDRAGRTDTFLFVAKAGSEVVAEVNARRLGSPLDSLVWMTDPSGRTVGMNDDYTDPGAGTLTHQADSYLRVRILKSGAYTVHIRDAQNHGGATYGYRLRLSAPRPDFALRVLPGSISGVSGATVVVTVRALRRDGFTGDIALSLNGAPQSAVLSGGRVPAKQDIVQMTLRLPVSRDSRQLALRMVGRAMVDGNEVVREAVPCEDMMQAFAYHHLVPDDVWLANISGRRYGATVLTLPDSGPLKITPGGTARLRVGVPTWVPASQVRLALSDPPEGLEVRKTETEGGYVVFTLGAAPGKLKPGLEGNLIAEAYREIEVPATGKTAARTRRASIALLPAIPFQVTTAR